MSTDPLEFVKVKVISILSELMEKPEQQDNLLALLVNKLGDLDKKIASKTSYYLICLVQKQSDMKAKVIKQVEKLIFRPNVSERARYYAITFLNQIVLSHKSQDVECANHLIDIYFKIFEILIQTQTKKNDLQGIHAKMMTGLLTGVNRAFPFSKIQNEK